MKALDVAPVGNDLLPDTDNDADGLIPLKITRGVGAISCATVSVWGYGFAFSSRRRPRTFPVQGHAEAAPHEAVGQRPMATGRLHTLPTQ